jgi:hypothetical protein
VQSYQFKQFVKECLLLLLSKKRLPRLKEKAIGAVSGSATKQRLNRFARQNPMTEHGYPIPSMLTKIKTICYTARNR